MNKLENMKVNVDLADEIPEEFKSSKWYETIKNRSKISTNFKEFEKMNTYRLYWRNIEIGQFFAVTMDMGYVDGIVKINDSNQAKDFIALASKLDLKIVMDIPLKV